MIDKSDIFAIKRSTVFIQQIVHHHRCSIPIVGRIVEHPVEHFAIGSRRAAITHSVQWNSICGYFRDKLICDARGKWLINQRAFALGGLVTFNTLLGIVSCFTFQNAEHLTANATITGIQHVEIVLIPIRNWCSASRIRASAIGQIRNDQLGQSGACGQRARKGHRCKCLKFHRYILPRFPIVSCAGGNPNRRSCAR